MASSSMHYRLPVTMGLGGVAIGNEFEPVTDEDAHATLQSAWRAGIRYYDVAPWYGLGLSERRYGYFLHNMPRHEFIISSKVGKLLKASKQVFPAKGPFPFSPSPDSVIFDYSADGVKRSIEDSLQRMGLDSLDIVYVHDLSPDNPLFKEGEWLEHFAVAEKGAFKALTEMREQGMIKAWGLGVNTPEPVLKTLEVADPDMFMFAKQYSLIDHEYSLHHVFPEIRKHNVTLAMGSNLNAGFLAGSQRYNYGSEIPAEAIQKRQRLQAIAAGHHVELRVAALQFALFPDVAAAIVPGAHTPQQVQENVAALQVMIPADFWQQLKHEGLICEDAPTSKNLTPTSKDGMGEKA